VRSGIALFALTACSFEPGFVVMDDGGSADSSIDTPTSPRVVDSVLAQWRLDDGGGMTVTATSGGLPLAIPMNGPVTWQAGGLHIDGPVQIASGDSRALINMVRAGTGVTLEAWLTTDNATQGMADYAAPVTISVSVNARDATIEQIGGSWTGRIRTTDPGVDKNGAPRIVGGAVDPTKAQHLVLVADPTQRVLYVDGVAASSTPSGAGAVSMWDNTSRVVFGNERGGGAAHAWAGTVWLVTLYGRALTQAEVMQNFVAGHDCTDC
jgi:hypothetical protein